MFGTPIALVSLISSGQLQMLSCAEALIVVFDFSLVQSVLSEDVIP